MFSIVLWGGFAFCRSGARAPERQKVSFSFESPFKTIALDGPGHVVTLRGSARSLDEWRLRGNSGRYSSRRRACQGKIVSVSRGRVEPAWGIPTQLFFSRRALTGNADINVNQQRAPLIELRSVFAMEPHLSRKTCVGIRPTRPALMQYTDTTFFERASAHAKYRHKFQSATDLSRRTQVGIPHGVAPAMKNLCRYVASASSARQEYRHSLFKQVLRFCEIPTQLLIE